MKPTEPTVIRLTPADAGGDAATALEQALASARRADPGGHPGTVIELAGGTYIFARGVKLTAADSGTLATPRVIRAARGATVICSGGRQLTGFGPVTDAAVLKRLPPEARSAVRQVDLRAQGITDFGTFHSRGFSRPVAPAMLELFHQGKPMPLAHWPKAGFAAIKGFPPEFATDDGHGGRIGALANGFFYEGERPAGWSNVGDILVHGYWAWDWADSYERIAALDSKPHLIQLAAPGGNYGYRTGQRIQYLNILEELNAPGEWYLDRQAGRLYFWPPSPLGASDVTVSLLEEPFLSLTNTAQVLIEGFTFTDSRGTGIHVTGGTGCRIEHCRFRNLGNYGVIVTGGTDHAVCGCELTELGDGGVDISGGDRQTLTPAGHVVEDNHIHHIARWSKCYSPAVLASGVGIRIAHNLIHNHPHTAILFWGNGFTIEYNEIHHVCLETGDAGAIYTGRNYSFRENLVRYNFLHHVSGVGLGSMGVYNDDCVSGTAMVGNLFWQVQRAVFLGGGRDFRVENNVFVDCTPAVALDGRGLSPAPVWHDMVYGTMKQSLEAVHWRQPPYSTRYPELADLVPYYAKPDGIPPGNILVARNVCVGGQWTEIGWGATPDMARFQDNLVGQDPGFVDAAHGNFALKPDSPARKLGFQPLPLRDIGPRPAAKRK